MAATIIDGKAVADRMTADLKAEIEAFKASGGRSHWARNAPLHISTLPSVPKITTPSRSWLSAA